MAVMDPDDERLSYIPLDRATRTKGIVYAVHDAWWSVHPERGLVMYRNHSPQYNHSESISRDFTTRLYPWAEVRQIPLVLVKVSI